VGLLAIVVALVAAGCGGASDYSLGKTRSCLVKKDVRIGGKLDFVASTATGGAFVAHLRRNFVTIVFGEKNGDAEQIELAYQRFAFPNVRPGLADVLKRERNAVMLWHEHPQDRDLTLVRSCLR
jgi:hypothetical protein